ncbi:MAG: S-layer homology domain-containing protein, partial [Candidatus Gracilibacteria bacterium]|nr:S-layer homology domain-containing protein [Candidatus Gracilibacteria bacterium]
MANVGFFDGVNIGLGRESAILYTINPLKFVNDNLTNLSILTHNTIVENENKSNNSTTNNDENNPVAEINNTDLPNQQETINNENTGTIIVKEYLVDDNAIIENINHENNLVNTNQIEKKQMITSQIELLSSLSPQLALAEANGNNELSYVSGDELSKSLEKIDNPEDNLEKILETKIDNTLQTSTGTDLIKKPLNYENTLSGNIINSETGIIDSNSGITIQEIQTSTGEKLFLDINNDYKYFKELKYFKDNSIISGFSDGTFKPNNNLSRIEALKIILLGNNINIIKSNENIFLDIKNNSWENSYIKTAIENKLISLSNKYFFPFRSISKVEALKMILSLKNIDYSKLKNDLNFDDIKTTDWYYKYVNYAVKNNLFNEKFNDKFYPNKALTREELVVILYNFIFRK